MPAPPVSLPCLPLTLPSVPHTQASALAKAMSDERGGKVAVTVLMEGENDAEWWRALGAKVLLPLGVAG